MDLLLKVGLAAVIVIAVAGLASLFLSGSANASLTSQKAVQFVLNDVRLDNPTANVTVVNVSRSKLRPDSWYVVLSVVYNGNRACPTLSIKSFDYPATGLVPSVDNIYTANCTIYGISTAPSYVISSPQIAAVRSYDLKVPAITEYVSAYGYGNVNVHAVFYRNLAPGDTPLGRALSDAWIVNYTAPKANYSAFVAIDLSGSPLGSYTLRK